MNRLKKFASVAVLGAQPKNLCNPFESLTTVQYATCAKRVAKLGIVKANQARWE